MLAKYPGPVPRLANPSWLRFSNADKGFREGDQISDKIWASIFQGEIPKFLIPGVAN